jgi:hypothetical protein
MFEYSYINHYYDLKRLKIWFINNCPISIRYEAYKIWSAWIIEQRSFGKSVDFFLPNTADAPCDSGQLFLVLREKGADPATASSFLKVFYQLVECMCKAHFYLYLQYNPELEVQPHVLFHRQFITLTYQSIKYVLKDTHYYKLSTYYHSMRVDKKSIAGDNALHLTMWKMMNNYYLLDGHSYQWAIPHRILKMLRENLNVQTELFASPLNAYYRRYYSLFEIDKEFGALGNFFEAPDTDFQTGVFQVNPPFIDRIFQATVDKIITLLTSAQTNNRKLMFIFFMPNWLDSLAYSAIKKSDFCHTEIILGTNEHYYYSYRDNRHINAQFSTHILVLANELAKPLFTRSVYRNLINIFKNPI